MSDEDQPAPLLEEEALKEKIVAALRTVYDPEIPVNLYDLGLIYRIEVTRAEKIEEAPLFDTVVDMTLTTAGCPLADLMPTLVHHALESLPEINQIVVNLVWDPPWDKSMMSDDARMALDLF